MKFNFSVHKWTTAAGRGMMNSVDIYNKLWIWSMYHDYANERQHCELFKRTHGRKERERGKMVVNWTRANDLQTFS